MQHTPQRHGDACLERIVEILKRRLESKRGLERADQACDMKLARHIEMQDKNSAHDGVTGAPPVGTNKPLRQTAHDMQDRSATPRALSPGARLTRVRNTGQANISLHVTSHHSASTHVTSSTNTPSQVIAHSSSQQPSSASAMHAPRPEMRHVGDTLGQDYAPQTKRSRQKRDDVDMGELAEYGMEVKEGVTTKVHIARG